MGEVSHPVVQDAEAEVDGVDGAHALGTAFYLLEQKGVPAGLASG